MESYDPGIFKLVEELEVNKKKKIEEKKLKIEREKEIEKQRKLEEKKKDIKNKVKQKPKRDENAIAAQEKGRVIS